MPSTTTTLLIRSTSGMAGAIIVVARIIAIAGVISP
jgi:hypothetical protein